MAEDWNAFYRDVIRRVNQAETALAVLVRSLETKLDPDADTIARYTTRCGSLTL
jgi:hypothetical protein